MVWNYDKVSHSLVTYSPIYVLPYGTD